MDIETKQNISNVYEAYQTFFEFGSFSGMLEIFLGYLILLLSLYSSSMQVYFRNSLNKTEAFLPNYYFSGGFSFFLAALLVFNEDCKACLGSSNALDFVIMGDYLSFVTKEAICASVFVFFLSLGFNRSRLSLSNSFEYTCFVVAGALGSLLLCSSGDLLTSFLALELQSISFCLMVAARKNSNHATDSSLKYFITGAFASSFFLLGSSIVYLSFGTVTYEKLNVIISLLSKTGTNQPPLILAQTGFLVLGISILIKLAAAPFHFWSIDVYEGAPTPTTYFFAIVPKIALFTLLYRLFYRTSFVLLVSGDFAIPYYILAVSCVVVGSLGSLEQRRLKSLMAYSSVSHVGYSLVSLGSGNELSPVFMYYYLLFYMVAAFCFWFVFMFLKKKKNSQGQKLNKELGDLTLLFKTNPILAYAVGLSLFSMAGIPPLVGFLTKFGSFMMPVHASGFYAVLAAFTASMVSTFFYIRLLKIIFFENAAVGELYHPINSKKAILISLFSFFLVLLFLKPALAYLAIDKACCFFL